MSYELRITYYGELHSKRNKPMLNTAFEVGPTVKPLGDDRATAVKFFMNRWTYYHNQRNIRSVEHDTLFTRDLYDGDTKVAKEWLQKTGGMYPLKRSINPKPEVANAQKVTTKKDLVIPGDPQ